MCLPTYLTFSDQLIPETHLFFYLAKAEIFMKKIIGIIMYSKTCLKGHCKIEKTKILMTKGNLLKVQRIAKCSPWSILQYFDLH